MLLKILRPKGFSFLFVFQVVFCFLIALLIASLVTPYILFLKMVAYLLATLARALQTAC